MHTVGISEKHSASFMNFNKVNSVIEMCMDDFEKFTFLHDKSIHNDTFSLHKNRTSS